MIDNTEQKLNQALHCEAVIHMDPVVTGDAQVAKTKQKMLEIVHSIDETISMHDFRMVTGPTHTNLIFDVLVPFKYKLSDEELLEKLNRYTKQELGDNYYLVVKVDKSYV